MSRERPKSLQDSLESGTKPGQRRIARDDVPAQANSSDSNPISSSGVSTATGLRPTSESASPWPTWFAVS